YGRSLIFMGSDRRAAAALGISPWRYKMFAFALCGILAGLAGVCFAFLYQVPPGSHNYVSFVSLFYLAIPVLAGSESLLAIVAVAVPLSLLPQWLESFHINALLMGGVALVGGTLLGARGLGGVAMETWRRMRRREWRARGSPGGIDPSERGPVPVTLVDGSLPLDEKRKPALAV